MGNKRNDLLLEQARASAEKFKSEYLASLPDEEVNKLIRIAGTDYDRRRRTDEQQRKLMYYLHMECGFSADLTGKVVGCSPNCVRYHCHPEWKATHNKNRTKYDNYNNSHFEGEKSVRAEYKRSLAINGKSANTYRIQNRKKGVEL